MYQKHNKNDIIAQGEVLLRAKGYHDTGVNDILDACQISKGSFYNFFNSKEDFCEQVIAYYGQYMFEYIQRFTSDTSLPPLDRLRNLYYSLVQYAEKEDCRKGCLLYNMSFELGGTSDAIAQALDTQFERWLTLVAACIKEGQETGGIMATKSAYELASVVHTAVNGAYGRVKIKRSSLPMKEVVDTFLDMIAR